MPQLPLEHLGHFKLGKESHSVSIATQFKSLTFFVYRFGLEMIIQLVFGKCRSHTFSCLVIFSLKWRWYNKSTHWMLKFYGFKLKNVLAHTLPCYNTSLLWRCPCLNAPSIRLNRSKIQSVNHEPFVWHRILLV
jgi:hypothetical protein